MSPCPPYDRRPWWLCRAMSTDGVMLQSCWVQAPTALASTYITGQRWVARSTLVPSVWKCCLHRYLFILASLRSFSALNIALSWLLTLGITVDNSISLIRANRHLLDCLPATFVKVPPPSTASQHYDLRRRSHDTRFHFPDTLHICRTNFITRMLYKHCY